MISIVSESNQTLSLEEMKDLQDLVSLYLPWFEPYEIQSPMSFRGYSIDDLWTQGLLYCVEQKLSCVFLKNWITPLQQQIPNLSLSSWSQLRPRIRKSFKSYLEHLIQEDHPNQKQYHMAFKNLGIQLK